MFSEQWAVHCPSSFSLFNSFSFSYQKKKISLKFCVRIYLSIDLNFYKQQFFYFAFSYSDFELNAGNGFYLKECFNNYECDYGQTCDEEFHICVPNVYNKGDGSL